jgi:hypothetical protein
LFIFTTIASHANTSQLTDLNCFPRAFITNHKLKGQLYSVEVDWWLCSLLIGRTPFLSIPTYKHK